jgi:DNA-binding HxlR family transcriptional regulator
MTAKVKFEHRSACPIASTLDAVGDKWSMVILRDLLTGKRRFGQFLTSPERITTNVLAERLARLEAFGLIKKQAYSEHPPRFEYLLTEKGAGLLPVLQDISRWANRYLPGTWRPPDMFMRMKVKRYGRKSQTSL